MAGLETGSDNHIIDNSVAKLDHSIDHSNTLVANYDDHNDDIDNINDTTHNNVVANNYNHNNTTNHHNANSR